MFEASLMLFGHYGFLVRNLIAKDFKIRYRNMSLGIFWSLMNPLVMMLVLTFVFTRLFTANPIPNFAVFALCALVPFNFFTVAFASGTTCILENHTLIKKVSFPREIIPVSTVLANCLHFAIQIGLLLVFVLGYGYEPNRYWFLLPVVWGLEVIFVCGLTMVTSALDVYFRDIRYVVESSNVVMFWLVPIFYSHSVVPPRYAWIHEVNPISAVVLACRRILFEAQAPPNSLMLKLTAVSVGMLILGTLIFHRLKDRFSDFL